MHKVNILQLSQVADQVCPAEIASIISRGVKINGFHTRTRRGVTAMITNRSGAIADIPKTIDLIIEKMEKQRQAIPRKFTVLVLG